MKGDSGNRDLSIWQVIVFNSFFFFFFPSFSQLYNETCFIIFIRWDEDLKSRMLTI